MSAKAEPLRRFKATGDDGKEYTITEFATQHVGDDDPATSPAPPHYKTDDGRSVESRNDGTYVLLQTGATLRAE